MTEKEEKAERRALMQEFGCTELEAAFRVARKLDRLRGLVANDEEAGSQAA
ncbi:conjugative transfer ATPase, PFL_4706 family [Serratia liquefaciens]|nr:conjugative transfer ATPase, PFL_4706 family [Serratia liquefaciens]